MSSQAAPVGLSDAEFDRYDVLAAKSKAGLSDAEMGEYDGLAAKARPSVAHPQYVPVAPAVGWRRRRADEQAAANERLTRVYGDDPRLAAAASHAQHAREMTMVPDIIGETVHEIAGPITRQRADLGASKSADVGAAANAAGGILASPLTVLGKAVPLVGRILSAVGGKLDRNIAQPAGYAVKGFPDAPDTMPAGQTIDPEGERFIDPGTRGVTNLVAPILLEWAAGVGLKRGGAALESARVAAENRGMTPASEVSIPAPEPVRGPVSGEGGARVRSRFQMNEGPVGSPARLEGAVPRATTDILPRMAPQDPTAALRSSTEPSYTAKLPPIPEEYVPNTVRTGLDARVLKAAFRSLDDAVRQARTGDPNSGLMMLRPSDLAAVNELAKTPYVGERWIGPRGDSTYSPRGVEPEPDLPPYRARVRDVGSTREWDTTTKANEAESTLGSRFRDSVMEQDVSPPKRGAKLGTVRQAAGDGAGRQDAAGSGSAGEPWGDRTREGMSPLYATDRNIDTLKRYGPEGEKLTEKLRAFDHEVRGMSADWNYRVTEQLKRLTAEERQILAEKGRAIAERRMTPPTPGIARLVEWWNGPNGEASRLAEHVNESGSWINDSRTGPRKIRVGTSDYAPQVPKGEWLDAVSKGDPDALAVVNREMVGPGKEFATTGEAVEALRHYRDVALKPLNPGTEAPRLRHLPDEVVEQDFFKLVRNYGDKAIRSAAEHRQFRYLDETGQPRNIRAGSGPQGDLGDLIEGIERNRGAGDAAAAKSKTLDLLGRNPLDWSSPARLQREIGARIGAVNAVRFYTRLTSWARNLTQLPHAWGFLGERPLIEGAAKLATSYNEVRKGALRTNAVDPLVRFSETMGVTERDFGDQAAGAGRKVAGAIMSPFGFFDRQPRLLTAAAAEPFARSLARQFAGSAREQAVAAAKASAMDLPSDLVGRLKSNSMTHGDMDTFTRELVDLVNVRISRANRLPASAAAGLDRQINWQGKNFNAEQSRSFKRIAVDQLRVGNPLPMLRVTAGTLGAGAGMIALFNFLRGPSSHMPSTAPNAMKQGGLAGAAGDLAFSMVPDAEGKTKVRAYIDRINDDQFAQLMGEVAELADRMGAPPTIRRIPVGEAGVTLDVKKDRWDVFLDAVRKIAPAGAEAERGLNRLFGDDSIVRREAGAKALRARAKAKGVHLEVGK